MRVLNREYFRKIKDYIEDYFGRYDKSPTVREIEAGTKISRATVQRYLEIMRDSGEIYYNGFRGIETDKMRKMKSENSTLVGLVGSISCGQPAFAEENIEEYFRLPTSLVGRGEYFLLRASGDSMIEAGINDGDLVLIRQQNTASAGQIVVALIDNDTTLKRFFPEPENSRIRLHPENNSMDDFYVSELLIQGVATKVLKDLV